MKNRFYLGASFLFIFCTLLTCFVGEIPFEKVLSGAYQRLQGLSHEWNPLLDERIPRLIVIFCTGASLAVCGAVMQALFQNPLAAPSVLGITCGGNLLAIPVFIWQGHITTPFALPVAAFMGCLLTLLFVYNLARRQGMLQMETLILTGIAVATLLLAIQSTLLYALRDKWQLIQMVSEWIAGSTIDRNWKHVHMQLPLTLIGLFGCWRYRQELNVLSLGDEEALNLGVDVVKVRWRLFLCVALLTAGALAGVGSIAFYGLILPHIIRGIWGTDCRQLIPYCMVGGALVFALTDVTLRLFDVRILSSGNIFALFGGFFFLYLLSKPSPRYA